MGQTPPTLWVKIKIGTKVFYLRVSLFQYDRSVGPICYPDYSLKKHIQQECIPVVTPATVAVSEGLHTPLDQHPPGPGPPLGPGTPWNQPPPRDQAPPLWTETLTHATQNITLPQTSFAGGKYV